MGKRKKIGGVRTTASPPKPGEGGRTSGTVGSGTLPTGTAAQRPSEDHPFVGIQLPGDVTVWLEEAAHRLAMAICTYCDHMFVPCNGCLRWAEAELKFAINSWKVAHGTSEADLAWPWRWDTIDSGRPGDLAAVGTDRAEDPGENGEPVRPATDPDQPGTKEI